MLRHDRLPEGGRAPPRRAPAVGGGADAGVVHRQEVVSDGPHRDRPPARAAPLRDVALHVRRQLASRHAEPPDQCGNVGEDHEVLARLPEVAPPPRRSRRIPSVRKRNVPIRTSGSRAWAKAAPSPVRQGGPSRAVASSPGFRCGAGSGAIEVARLVHHGGAVGMGRGRDGEEVAGRSHESFRDAQRGRSGPTFRRRDRQTTITHARPGDLHSGRSKPMRMSVVTPSTPRSAVPRSDRQPPRDRIRHCETGKPRPSPATTRLVVRPHLPLRPPEPASLHGAWPRPAR